MTNKIMQLILLLMFFVRMTNPSIAYLHFLTGKVKILVYNVYFYVNPLALEVFNKQK